MTKDSYYDLFISQFFSKLKNLIINKNDNEEYPKTSYSYYRLHINKTRNGMLPQLSKICFYDQNNEIIPQNVVSEYPKPGQSESATNLLKSTGKWYSGQNNIELEKIIPFDFISNLIDIIFEFDYPIIIQTYHFETANDEPDRDPISWTWYGSNDKKNYKLLKCEKNVNVCINRNTKYDSMSMAYIKNGSL